jgi:hypothetical protein
VTECTIGPVSGRRGLAWLSGAAGAVGLYRLARRRRPREGPAEPWPADARAAELRRRLEESRAVVGEREEFEAGETPVDRAEASAGLLRERRQRVHEEGRAATEQMLGRTADERTTERATENDPPAL